jgi:fumarylpyruvate hydrolase
MYVIDPAQRASVGVLGSQQRFPVRRIYCVGRNYAEHAREMGESDREPPFFFAKPADAVCTADFVPYPPMTENLHHEVELVVAIGAGGVKVTLEDAPSLVYGYAVGVDLTRRDLQAEAKKQGRSWATAKGFDCSAPISEIRPLSQCIDPGHAAIRLAVNGETRQQGNTGHMIWSVAEIIVELSRYFELRAGDLVFTGTPAGVGRLQAGDHVDCSIDGVGELAFTMKRTTY